MTSITRSHMASCCPAESTAVEPAALIDAWYGFIGPRGMPAELVIKINTDVASILKRSDFQERVTADALEPVGGTPEEFAAQIAADLGSWRRLIRAANIRVD